MILIYYDLILGYWDIKYIYIIYIYHTYIDSIYIYISYSWDSDPFFDIPRQYFFPGGFLLRSSSMP